MVSHTRKRIDRRRRYRHDGVAELHAQVPVSAKAGENVVVNVHVHNEIAPAGDPGAAKRRAKTAPPIRLPSFRGRLYSWKDHYQPIVNRLAPIVAQREKSRGEPGAALVPDGRGDRGGRGRRLRPPLASASAGEVIATLPGRTLPRCSSDTSRSASRRSGWRRARRSGALIAAPLLLDLLWPMFLIAGIESVRIDPGNTVFTPLDLHDYPYTHSLRHVGDLVAAGGERLLGGDALPERSARGRSGGLQPLDPGLRHPPARHADLSGEHDVSWGSGSGTPGPPRWRSRSRCSWPAW